MLTFQEIASGMCMVLQFVLIQLEIIHTMF